MTLASNLQNPHFFICQSEKLTTLQSTIVHESQTATNPDALIDYLELTHILADLLGEAQFYGVLSEEELAEREAEVRRYLGRVATLQDAVGDWEGRTKAVKMICGYEVRRDGVVGGGRDLRTRIPAGSMSRKRARSPEFGDGAMGGGFKRPRGSEDEPDFVVCSSITSSPVQNVLPSIEKSPTPWWTEPFYD